MDGDGTQIAPIYRYLAFLNSDRAIAEHRTDRRRSPHRAPPVQSVISTDLLLGFPTALLIPLRTAATVVSVIINPRGLSCALAGCTLRDARTPALAATDEPTESV